jgi:hypothetical protein
VFRDTSDHLDYWLRYSLPVLVAVRRGQLARDALLMMSADRVVLRGLQSLLLWPRSLRLGRRAQSHWLAQRAR